MHINGINFRKICHICAYFINNLPNFVIITKASPTTMQTEIIKLSQITLNASNPRTISEGKFSKLIDSILVLPKMLELRPVVVTDSYDALGGNMRTRALVAISQMTGDQIADRLGGLREFTKKTEAEQSALVDYWKQWLEAPTSPIVRASTLSADEQKEFIIKDNVGFGEWDYDMLANEWDSQALDDWGVDVWQDEPKAETEDDDYTDEDEANAPARCALGDVWKLGRHRLMCGDSTKADDVAKLMNGELADLLVTDPPYNVDYEGGMKKRKKIDNDQMNDDDFVEFLTLALSNASASMKKGGAFYIWHADNKSYDFHLALKNTDLVKKQTIIWNKNNFALGRQDYRWKHEPCLYGWKDGASHYFVDDRSLATVIDEKKPARSDIHPTMKPVKLIGQNIANSSKVGWLVLDLFGGSGTTLIASEELGRKCYIMEFDPHYCDAIIDRWEKMTNQKAEKL